MWKRLASAILRVHEADMLARTFQPILMTAALAALAAVFACGGSDGGTGSSAYACPAADPTKKSAACITCLHANCEDPMKNAYGSAWAAGMVGGGACPSSFVPCATRCACNDQTCASQCLSAAGASCEDAVIVAAACASASCGTPCQ